MLYTYAATLIVGLAVGFGGAWQTQNWRYGAIEAKRLSALVEAEKKRDWASYDAATTFEKGRARVETVFQTITETVETIVDRPIYRNVCFDDSGLQAIRDATAETGTGKPSGTMPTPE